MAQRNPITAAFHQCQAAIQLPKLKGRELNQKTSPSSFPVLYFLIKRTHEIK